MAGVPLAGHRTGYRAEQRCSENASAEGRAWAARERCRDHGRTRAKSRKKKGIKYFLVSFVDLFGAQRAKLVPAAAIDHGAKSAPALRDLRLGSI